MNSDLRGTVGTQEPAPQANCPGRRAGGPMRHAGGPNMRLLAARMILPLGARRAEIERLFARTAAAFGSTVPPRRARGVRGRLWEYAQFTRAHAEEALDGGGDIPALDSRLFRAALALGNSYRLRLKVRGTRDAMAAARLIYRGIGIDFKGSAEGDVVISRCAFASIYTPGVCTLISALDSGLLAGLSGGGVLEFRQRITEGADSCKACFMKGKR
jgi:hypothetical protein